MQPLELVLVHLATGELRRAGDLGTGCYLDATKQVVLVVLGLLVLLMVLGLLVLGLLLPPVLLAPGTRLWQWWSPVHAHRSSRQPPLLVAPPTAGCSSPARSGT